VIALVLALASATQPPPTFAASVEAVYVDAFVTDRHGPVAGLTAADFVLKDDGARRPVELVALDALPLTTLLVLDTSGSVAGEKLQALQAAGRLVVERLRGQPIGLVQFDHEVRLQVAPTTDATAVEIPLASLRTGGATALYDALYAATLLTPPRGRALIALFTDGEDNLSWLGRADLQAALDGSNVVLQAVGIVPAPTTEATNGYQDTRTARDEPPHVRILRQLAESTGGRFWSAGAASRLVATFEAMLDAMKARYVLRFEPEPGRPAGRHTLQVQLAGRRGTVHCRRSYFAGRRP
jgi:VWFA-related protein